MVVRIAKRERRMTEPEGQVFESKLSCDLFHESFDEYKEWGSISGFQRNMIDYEGSRSEQRGAEMQKVRLIPLTELSEITKLGSQSNFLHQTD